MKTLTLDEAFRKASEGPFTVTRDEAYQIPPLCIQASNGCANIAKLNPVMKGEVVNAALLAHCFNHMEEAYELIQELIVQADSQQHGQPHSMAHTIKAASDFLTKANTVTLPE